MVSFLASAVLALCLILSARLVHTLLRRARIKKQMPPGPPGLPVLGNLAQLTKLPWTVFTDWKGQYGSIITLDFAGQLVVVLGDFKVTGDLVDRRSAIYNDRPRFVMADEIMTEGMLLPLSRYTARWRRLRKATYEGFNAHSVKNYRPLQEIQAYKLLKTFLQDQGSWQEKFTQSLAATTLQLVYGITVSEACERRQVVNYIDDFVDRLAVAAFPGSYLVDLFPSMLRLPRWASPWRAKGEFSFQQDTAFFSALLDEVKEKTAAGTATRTFSSDVLNMVCDGDINESEAAWLAGVIYISGVETSSSALEMFILAMVLYPDVMRRAQAQIHEVVGSDRLPTFADYNDLPYIQAIVLEVLRWRPPLPLSLPKRCMQDDWYEGYYIPKGTLVLENVWAMNHDPTYFIDPEVFMPERHLDDTGKRVEPIPDTHGYSHGSFGAGRRICIGKDLVSQTLFIDIAVLLWGTTISPAVDNNGSPIIPSPDNMTVTGVVVRPAPFSCSVGAKFSGIHAIVEAALDDAYVVEPMRG